MRFITRLLSIAVGLAAGAAAVKLLHRQQEQGVFELSEDDYIELPQPDDHSQDAGSQPPQA